MPSRMLHLPSPSLPLPLLISAGFAISVVSSEGAAVDCSGGSELLVRGCSILPEQGKKHGVGSEKNTEVQQLRAFLCQSFPGRSVGYKAKEGWALLGAGLVGVRWVEPLCQR